MTTYEERIKEITESLADGRIHQFNEVEGAIATVMLLTRHELKRRAKESIDNLI